MPTATVMIDSIAAGGDGVARREGLVIFVPRTAPGDVGNVEYMMQGRMARGRLTSIETPGPSRVVPPCPHYTRDDCGGCQLQHLAIEGQRAAKARIVSDSLARIGGRPTEPPEIRSAGTPWRYRHKLTLALRRRGSGWIAGLHPWTDPAAVFPLDDCPITSELVISVWREIMDAAELLPAEPSLRGAVRVDDARSAQFTLEGGTHWKDSVAFFDRVTSLSALWWQRAVGEPTLLHHRGAASAPGASFSQVNGAVAERMQEHVLGIARRHAPESVVDAYSGVGDTAVALAMDGVAVRAIELDALASRRSATRLKPPSRAIHGRVEDTLAQALPADVVILNPPRAGVHARVTEILERESPRPRAIIYVSCNPATLARDLKRLPSWRIASLIAFDMFPQTAHVETVCELVEERTAA
jgi:23S rRNA (uracil1939-C5)-methyltransferase